MKFNESNIKENLKKILTFFCILVIIFQSLNYVFLDGKLIPFILTNSSMVFVILGLNLKEKKK